jgi:tetratricopeptide (TPR) repeat protein
MPSTYYFHREMTRYFRSSLILALLLLSSLHLQAYSIPALQMVGGQNMNLAVAVKKVSAPRMQLPSEQLSGPALPIAPPTPAIDVKVNFDSGVRSLGKLDYNKAITEFTEAIRLDPTFAPAYLGRGNAHSNQGNLDEAIRDYCEAIRLDPNYAIAYYNRGAIYQHKNKFSKAFSDYNAAIHLDPNCAPAFNNRGVVYGRKGDFNKAISDFTEAIRLDPNYAIAYENRGVVYFHTGKRAKANADFATARQLGRR